MVFSRRVDNDEPDMRAVIADVGALGRPVCWAVDVTTGLSALLLTLLWAKGVEVRYVSGTVAFHMAAAFAGENKTPATPRSSRIPCGCARTCRCWPRPTGCSRS
jgi:transposase